MRFRLFFGSLDHADYETHENVPHLKRILNFHYIWCLCGANEDTRTISLRMALLNALLQLSINFVFVFFLLLLLSFRLLVAVAEPIGGERGRQAKKNERNRKTYNLIWLHQLFRIGRFQMN